jgi:hypothetical protein
LSEVVPDGVYLFQKIRVTDPSRTVGPGVKPFGRKAAGLKERRFMFDYKLLIHPTNAIARIVYEIKPARTPISLQQISTAPVEKKFGKTRMHATVHQAVIGLVKTIEDDGTMQFIYIQNQIKSRRLAYGETISFCTV